MSAAGIPGFWQHETSGVLRPAISAYLNGGAMTPDHVTAMRAYLRQWIAADGWAGQHGEVDALRADVDSLVDRTTIQAWLDKAGDIGIDPL